MQIDDKYLQAEIGLILHHVEDILKGLEDKDLEYCKKGTLDIKEVAERLKDLLPKDNQEAIEMTSEAQLARFLLRNARYGSLIQENKKPNSIEIELGLRD